MNTINIKALSEQVSKLSASGSSLPDVTTADNGKVLGVVEGSWNKMDAPSGGVDYSTTEQNTGRKWIDNSDIYQITLNLGTLPNNSAITADLPTGFDKLINMFGMCYASNETDVQRPLPFPANSTNPIRCDIQSGVFRLTTYSDWTEYTGIITLLYTKATTTKSKKKTTK